MIPVFVGFAVYYGHSVHDGDPQEWLRVTAVVLFSTAALSDALDGYVARHYHQKSRLGSILDPLADKLLLLSAVGVLAFSDWPARLPLWFVIVVLSREVLSIAGAFLIDHVAGHLEIRMHWTGKFATFFLLLTAGCSMMRWDALMFWSAVIAVGFTVISGALHIAEAVRQMNNTPSGKPQS